VKETKKAFRETINEYINRCKKFGKTPKTIFYGWNEALRIFDFLHCLSLCKNEWRDNKKRINNKLDRNQNNNFSCFKFEKGYFLRK